MTVKDVLRILKITSSDTIKVALGQQPGRRINIGKEKLEELARRMKAIGGRLWVPVPFTHKLAIEAPYNILISNIDVFLYPDTICSDLNCKAPPDEPELTLIRMRNGTALLLINTDSVDAYKKIVEFLADTSYTDIRIIEGEVYVPVEPEDIEEK